MVLAAHCFRGCQLRTASCIVSIAQSTPTSSSHTYIFIPPNFPWLICCNQVMLCTLPHSLVSSWYTCEQIHLYGYKVLKPSVGYVILDMGNIISLSNNEKKADGSVLKSPDKAEFPIQTFTRSPIQQNYVLFIQPLIPETYLIDTLHCDKWYHLLCGMVIDHYNPLWELLTPDHNCVYSCIRPRNEKTVIIYNIIYSICVSV